MAELLLELGERDAVLGGLVARYAMPHLVWVCAAARPSAVKTFLNTMRISIPLKRNILVISGLAPQPHKIQIQKCARSLLPHQRALVETATLLCSVGSSG